MSVSFRPAKRENVSLIIGIAGPSGGGKTYSAMRLAKGMAGGKRFAVIDTEAGRALHYADQFDFDYVDLKPPFKPSTFEEAIKAADKYSVVIVDNFSHEYAGEGGILDWQETELAESVKRAQARNGENRAEWQLRDSYKMSSWIRPKTEHKRMVQRLLQNRSHLILCLRAEEKIDMVKNKEGKVEIVQKQTLSGFKGWIPICEKNLLFELTASFILTPDKPGHPQPIKLEAQLRDFFPLDQPITEESGKKLAEWARGGESKVSAGRPLASESVPAAAAPELTGGAQDLFAGTDPILGLVDAITAERGRLGTVFEKPPSAEQWKKICKEIAGTETLEVADPAALQDLLGLLKKLTSKDLAAIQRVKKILT